MFGWLTDWLTSLVLYVYTQTTFKVHVQCSHLCLCEIDKINVSTLHIYYWMIASCRSHAVHTHCTAIHPYLCSAQQSHISRGSILNWAANKTNEGFAWCCCYDVQAKERTREKRSLVRTRTGKFLSLNLQVIWQKRPYTKACCIRPVSRVTFNCASDWWGKRIILHECAYCTHAYTPNPVFSREDAIKPNHKRMHWSWSHNINQLHMLLDIHLLCALALVVHSCVHAVILYWTRNCCMHIASCMHVFNHRSIDVCAILWTNNHLLHSESMLPDADVIYFWVQIIQFIYDL